MNKLALVTGGTCGVGAAISIRLKKAGYSVIANYTDNDAAAKSFYQTNNIPICKFNVASFSECQIALEDINRDFGAVAILVNNADITHNSSYRASTNTWQDAINAKLSSCFNMCRLVIDQMRENHFGRIVNISAINGQDAQFGKTNYATAKAGMMGFTKALAQESAAKGITVNTIAPGYIFTEIVRSVPETVLETVVSQIPEGRLGEADEIARCVEFLVADESGFITGSTISINGGQHIH
jgi:acetoacetyl-CoA reductase